MIDALSFCLYVYRQNCPNARKRKFSISSGIASLAVDFVDNMCLTPLHLFHHLKVQVPVWVCVDGGRKVPRPS